MENVDKDVAAMLESLKKYDILKESVAPVLTARKIDEKKGGKPEWLEDAEKKSENKEGESDSEGGELDEDTHLAGGKKSKWSDKPEDHFKGPIDKIADKFKKKDDKKEEVKEEADQEVLSWMKRFSNLGKMSGYNR